MAARYGRVRPRRVTHHGQVPMYLGRWGVACGHVHDLFSERSRVHGYGLPLCLVLSTNLYFSPGCCVGGKRFPLTPVISSPVCPPRGPTTSY